MTNGRNGYTVGNQWTHSRKELVLSIEMPEATILARQMQAELVGKTVAGFELKGCENFRRIGFINKDDASLERLVGETIERAVSRGNTMVLKLTGEQNLVLSPEYGGEIFYHAPEMARAARPARYHLWLPFSDGSALTVHIKTMGGFYATCEVGLAEHYLVRRDFDPERPEPDDAALTAERFARLIGGVTRQLKTVLVGKDAVVVGLSNSAFQDILFRAGLHPTRRAADLAPEETQRLYDAMRLVVSERLARGGKSSFRDLYGRPGGYEPAMGPALKGRDCPACGTAVQKLTHGGGYVFLCPACQR